MGRGGRAAVGFLAIVPCLAAVNASATPRASVELHEGWTFRQVGRDDWYPAAVPGVVHLDLVTNRLVADPFHGDNEKGLQWIGKTDWEYRSEFGVPSDVLGRKHVELVFDGLDTYATVFLNGKRVLEADNFYRQWRVPVTGLRPAGNELRVVFASPINKDLPKVAARGYVLPAANDHGEKTSVYTRKPPYQFGWDWGPRFVTCGIWRPVRLEAWDDARIVDVSVRQDALGDDEARLTAVVEVEAAKRPGAGLPATLEVRVEGVPVASTKGRLQAGLGTHEVAFTIENPKRWWPNGYGEQALYGVTTRLAVGGSVVDETATRIGLRTLELRRERDVHGRSFEFVVNGVPVFAKGANWIPADSFPSRLTRERYADLLGSARDARMNMLRVWGGGLYEADAFYELADEMGLLIWQDFHFSCSLYPADRDFLASVEAEAEQAVRRLRNHPSLALWNGNNEIETAWLGWGWKATLPGWLWNDYRALFHDLLPKVVARLDPGRSYWPSSPSADGEAAPGDPGTGDAHYWGVWHGGEPFSAFERQRTRFMSEYGFQSFPEMRTLRAFAGDADLALDSPAMTSHQKHPRGNQLIREYMLREYREPKDFASFVYVSQVQQAEGIKRGAEHLRRSRPRTMGSLYWQLDDCWPGASWSSLDYFGRWKALHYYARRFHADLLLSAWAEGDDVVVHAVSDLTAAVAGRLEVELVDFSGATLWRRERDVTVGPLAAEEHFRIRWAELLAGRDLAGVFLHGRLVSGGREPAETSLFFAPTRELKLDRPAVRVAVAPADAGFEVTLETDVVARHVRLAYDADEGRFDDNFFDLVPGRPVRVVYRPRAVVEIEAFRNGLVVQSIVDAFADPDPKR